MKKRVLILICFAFFVLLTGFLFYKMKLPVQANKNSQIVVTVVDEKENELGNLIDAYLEENQVDKDRIAIYVKSYYVNEEYTWNIQKEFVAASTYKLPLAMKYYEMSANGEINLNDTLVFTAHDYESGGPVGYYPFNTTFTMNTLLEYMIVYSDNSAAHILFNNLGGWESYKKAIQKYTTHDVSENYYIHKNIITAQYLSDALDYLYRHQDIYTKLIQDMQNAMPSEYLNLYLPNVTAQKYGCYDWAQNSAGIVFSNYPYSIVVLTSLGSKGIEHMGHINEICYDYFVSKNYLKYPVTHE